ncbi:MAG: sulfurtransferase-like selenium metabolism protein YedF [Sedimentibacter sp.]|uniref:sulfurtransferase-like selenium metabolism protein YedF n=1 Tax=Sedimentibacter sp. TaxID=1960295 RepID=UPI002982B35E|nr:sulfurtransferase-like selenium metabolism protein YedF [Sedimentibacter sp.]MDW5300441.1 sulfurtransferase-like selenium metabolism protein YedF [Sedimentibacter sp.]
MKIVDVRGKLCPQPVILTKKEVDNGELEITVIVDNETAKSNVLKLGSKLNYTTTTENKNDGMYVYLSKYNGEEHDVIKVQEHQNVQNIKEENKVYVFGQDKLGKGSDDLGKMLMKGFIYAISERKPYPEFLIFLNSGVNLTTTGSESLDDLKNLENAGVKIVSCGTCLDFFEIKSKLEVGIISNMYDIVDIIAGSDNVVTI